MWLIVAILVLAVLGAILQALGYEPATDAEPSETVSEPAESSNAPTEPDEVVVDTSALAADVEATVLASLDADSWEAACIPEVSWPCGITAIEGTDTEGVVNVVISDDNDRPVSDVLRGVMNFACRDHEELLRVVAVDGSGATLDYGRRADYTACA